MTKQVDWYYSYVMAISVSGNYLPYLIPCSDIKEFIQIIMALFIEILKNGCIYKSLVTSLNVQTLHEICALIYLTVSKKHALV